VFKLTAKVHKVCDITNIFCITHFTFMKKINVKQADYTLSELTEKQLSLTGYKLPELIQSGLNQLERNTDKVLFTLSAITSLSSVMPNVRIHINEEVFRTNLYACIVGNSGTGKNSIKLGLDLVEPYHKALVHETKQKIEYAKARAAAEGKGDGSEIKIPDRLLIVSENTTEPALFDKLEDNQYFNLLLFAEELRGLKGSMSKEHGDILTILLQVKENGRVSKSLKGDKYQREATDTYLSLLTSTTRQDIDTLGDTVNGMFNRVLWYIIPDLMPDDYKMKRTRISPSENTRAFFKKRAKKSHTRAIGKSLLPRIMSFLEYYSNAVNKLDYESTDDKEEAIDDATHIFYLKTEQEDELEANTQRLLADFDGEDLNGLKVRLNNDIAKVAAVLTFCDNLDLERPTEIVCSDDYFETAKHIVYTCFDHARVLFHYQTQSEHIGKRLAESKGKLDAFERALLNDIERDVYTTGELLAIAQRCNISKPTAERWLRQGKVGFLESIAHGKYAKLNQPAQVQKAPLRIA
jgi:hypothetical protein